MDLEKVFKNIVLLDLAIFVLLFVSILMEPEEIASISESLGTGIWDENTIIGLPIKKIKDFLNK